MANAAKYYHQDHLSNRVLSNASGGIVEERGHYPFGETWYEPGGASKLKFTSYERDAESGTDYAMARYFVNRLGRFNQPDRLAGSITDPQSLNRYAYTRNDPINLADPVGLESEPSALLGPHWTDAFLAGEIPFINPFEFDLALMGAGTRRHFGAAYYGLPGRADPRAEGEARYLAWLDEQLMRALLERMKPELEATLRRPECEKLFGGAKKVTELLSAIGPNSVRDVTAPSFVPETPSQTIAAADIRGGVAAAVFPGYGGSFLVLVGRQFSI